MPKAIVHNVHSEMPWTHSAIELIDDAGNSEYYSLYPVLPKKEEGVDLSSGRDEEDVTGLLLHLTETFLAPILGPIPGQFKGKEAEAGCPRDTVTYDLSDAQFSKLSKTLEQMKQEVLDGKRSYAATPLRGDSCANFVRSALKEGLSDLPNTDNCLSLSFAQSIILWPADLFEQVKVHAEGRELPARASFSDWLTTRMPEIKLPKQEDLLPKLTEFQPSIPTGAHGGMVYAAHKAYPIVSPKLSKAVRALPKSAKVAGSALLTAGFVANMARTRVTAPALTSSPTLPHRFRR
jgi:hypothetical protein